MVKEAAYHRGVGQNNRVSGFLRELLVVHDSSDSSE